MRLHGELILKRHACTKGCVGLIMYLAIGRYSRREKTREKTFAWEERKETNAKGCEWPKRARSRANVGMSCEDVRMRGKREKCEYTMCTSSRFSWEREKNIKEI